MYCVEDKRTKTKLCIKIKKEYRLSNVIPYHGGLCGTGENVSEGLKNKSKTKHPMKVFKYHCLPCTKTTRRWRYGGRWVVSRGAEKINTATKKLQYTKFCCIHTFHLHEGRRPKMTWVPQIYTFSRIQLHFLMKALLSSFLGSNDPLRSSTVQTLFVLKTFVKNYQTQHKNFNSLTPTWQVQGFSNCTPGFGL